ncbi:hypothetical protein B484DRAFT_441139 [Ochromonadaceae sp. CCMP2298]|nr:hypothetical protein B484DRAFT_441139 [Ochromonadaceae sp. CCMP2298]
MEGEREGEGEVERGEGERVEVETGESTMGDFKDASGSTSNSCRSLLTNISLSPINCDPPFAPDAPYDDNISSTTDMRPVGELTLRSPHKSPKRSPKHSPMGMGGGMGGSRGSPMGLAWVIPAHPTHTPLSPDAPEAASPTTPDENRPQALPPSPPLEPKCAMGGGKGVEGVGKGGGARFSLSHTSAFDKRKF